MQQIAELIKVSQRSTELLIDREITREVVRVQKEVRQRCDSFIDTLQVQMDEKLQQESQTLHVTNQLKERLKQVEAMLVDVACLKNQAENANAVDATSKAGLLSSSNAPAHGTYVR